MVDNSLGGTIPTELGGMVALRDLVIGYNALKGKIPIELSNLVQLRRLGINSNALTGSIPPAMVVNMANLTSL